MQNIAKFFLKIPERNEREYIIIHTFFNNYKGYSLYKVCMSTYFIVIVGIFIYYSKSMSSEAKNLLLSLSPSDDELKPSISTTDCVWKSR